jgi:glutaredoxin
MRTYLIVAATLWIVCSHAVGQAYRWVDERGQVHYTQTPPPQQAKEIQRKDFRSGASGSVDLPYATQIAAKNYPVTLYTQPDCGPPCDEARGSLVKRAVPFREVSVLGQKEIDEMKRVSGREDLPLLVVGSQFQTGFQENAINSLLDTAGYPPAGPRVPLESLRKTEPAPSSPSAQPSQQSAGGKPGTDSK